MKYLVLGGNAAGMSFAAKMKRNDASSEIIVIEKNDYVSFGACGLPYYVGDNFANEQRMIVKTPEEFQETGIDLRIKEEVLSVNEKAKEVEIKSQAKTYIETYDKLIISTGAKPIILNNVQPDYKKVFTLTSLEDGKKLKALIKEKSNLNIGIIGTGFIGLELMDALLDKEHTITMFTNTKTIMAPTYSAEIVEPIEVKLQKLTNLTIKNNVLIDKLEIKELVELSYDNQQEVFDIVVMCIGFKPNTAFISNVDKIPNGAIITDNKAQTSVKDIYAIGDCATVTNLITKKPMFLPLATTANKLGRMLADSLANKEVYFQGMLGTSAIKILDYELGKTGLGEQDCLDNQIAYKTKIITDFNQTNYYPGQEKIMAKIIYEAQTLQILGIEMVGKKGVIGRIDAMALAIHHKMTTAELGYADFAYAPPFARTWDFLNVIGNVSK
ncbi:MAG: CoA-disulfide reductase [Mycoplasmatales bacterium]